MESYEALVAGGEHGNAFIAGASASSRLVQMIEGKLEPRMPYKEEPLSRAQVQLIRRWIDEGAPGPAAADDEERSSPRALPDVKPRSAVPAAVAAVAFDPANRTIAVGTYQAVHLLSVADRTWTAKLNGHADLVRAVAFSPDGAHLAVAGGPSGRFGEIKVWDVRTSTPKVVSQIHGHTDAILAIAFSPDGRTIASASYDRLVKLWDVASGKQVKSLKEHADAVYDVVFLPDGKQLVTAAGDRTLKLWDVAEGKRIFTIGDALDAVYSVAVDPTGSRIAAAGVDRMIRTWSWNGTATLLQSAFAHGDAVLAVTYSPDGSRLISTGADRLVKVWDAATLRELRSFDAQPDWVLALAVSGDNKWLAAGRYDGTLGLYALTTDTAGEQFVVPR